jgi:hypothetical protein
MTVAEAHRVGQAQGRSIGARSRGALDQCSGITSRWLRKWTNFGHNGQESHCYKVLCVVNCAQFPPCGGSSESDGVELIDFIAMLLPLFLLGGLLAFSVIRLVIWISRKKVPWWVVASVSLGVIAILAAFPRVIGEMIGRVLEAAFNNGSLLFLSMLPLIIMIAIALWMIRASTAKGILAAFLYLALFCVGLTFISARYFVGMLRFESAVASALDGEIDPGADGRFQWKIRRDREDASRLRDLPPVSDVRCLSTLFPNGACCKVDYPDGRRSEIHIFRIGLRRFTVRKFTNPSYGLCRNPDFDPRADPGSPEGKEWIRCDQLSTV